jgi:AcrR family transcriptional regulator
MPTRTSDPQKASRIFQNRKRKPQLKRDAVLLTAAHLFLKQGYRRTSMEDIADQLEITKPALYHYFTSKDDILVGCYSHGITNILARLDHADKSSGTGLEKTREFLHVWIEVITTLEFGQCVVTLDDNELAPMARREVRKLKRRIDRMLRERISEGVADGTIKPCDERLVAFAFGGAINSIGTWYDPAGKLDHAAFASAFTDILIDGVSRVTRKKQRAVVAETKAKPAS